MITSPQRTPRSPSRRTLLLPALLAVPVVAAGLYAAGVPWAVAGLDAFWEGVDRLGRYSELMWAVTALSWAGVAWLVLRLHRLAQWDQRVLSALNAALDEAEVIRALGRSVLADLVQTRGVPRKDREWAASLLTALTPPPLDEAPEQKGQQ